ncbi:MAG: agmatine deiminase family protein [Pseudomonadota bacterium]
MSRFRMPAEWEPHASTFMGWPCRASSWGESLEQGRDEFADVANTIAALEPVTMVCTDEAQARVARTRLTEGVEILTRPMDGSWLRDNGPLFVTDGTWLQARRFRFNAWGERHADRDRDARLGRSLAEHLGLPVTSIDIVLEGGAITLDGAGTLIAPEACVMRPSRNWHLTKSSVERGLKEALGVDRVVWLPEGLAEDQQRDPERMYYGTDGHIDLFMCFIGPNRVLMLSVPDDNPNASTLAKSRTILEDAGIEVNDFRHMSGFIEDAHHYIAPYMNFYICNGAVIMPIAGEDPEADTDAQAALQTYFPNREVIAVQMRAAPKQGGAIHCMTQQVPAVEER